MNTLVYIFLIFILFSFQSVFAMESETYKINADSINLGGLSGSSENYNLNDTLGEVIIGEGSSASYKTKAGLQYMVNTYLSLTVDNSSKDLGSLLSGSPITGQTTTSVTTDSWGGYAIVVSKNHPMRHTDAVTEIDDANGSISVPLLWQSPNDLGFGFSIISGTNVDSKWGSSPNYKYAAFPNLAETAHLKSGFSSNLDETVFGYKTDVSTDQKSGSYASTVTYTAVAAL